MAAGKWDCVILREICELVNYGYTASAKPESIGPKFLRITDIVPDRVNWASVPHCRIDERKFSKYRLEKGDIVIARTGATTGYAKRIRENYDAVFASYLVRIRVNAKYDSRYVGFIIESESYKHFIQQNIGGTAQPQANAQVLTSFPIPLPPASTQRKIAAILSAYDGLIENNSRRIKILEEIAATIYREWFVEFRFPAHENVKMVESELGLIPQEWDAKFSDYVDFKEGPGLRRWQYRDEGIPFLNIRTLVDNDIDSSKLQYLDPDEVQTKYSHFLLSPNDHVVSSSGTLGRIVTIQRDHLPLMLNTSIIRMRAKTENVGPWQLKHFLKSDYFQRQINALATGTAQKNYGPSHLKHMKIVAPDSALGRKYEELVSPLEELLGVLVIKNANLRSTRDLLLPQLISGELDVSTLNVGTDLYRPQ